MKDVLILNRRCLLHPEKGGAEVYTFELAKALIEKGARVEWVSSRQKNLKAEETLEGITFIRKGNELTTHLCGFFYALKRKPSLILDEFNGVGFFTFLMKNSVVLVHQLYHEFWPAEFGFLGRPLKWMERASLALYRKKPAITVSASTNEDLKRLGFKDTTIILNGLDFSPLKRPPEKEKNLTLVFLGRLKKTKNPEDAVKALLLVRGSIPNARLWIIGDGPLTKPLKNTYSQIEGIHFSGFVSDVEKYELLKKAHLLLVPSIREGWGQVVIQANAVGTPAIGYGVKGLQDSIQDGKTGFLVKDYSGMAERAIDLWKDPDKYFGTSQNALEWARHFSWEKTKREFISCLERRGLL